MSKAVSAVKKVGSSLFGGGGQSTGAFGTGRFKGTERNIDSKAFQIEGAKEAAERAREREKESTARSKQAQQDRRSLITDLQAQAAGTAPSLAEAQLKSASDRSLAQQLAAAQSQRGGSASAMQRNLARNQATAGRELAQDAATARLQERQMAQTLLGDQISQEQQASDQLTQNYLQMGFTIEQARQQAQADLEKARTSQHLQAQGLTAQGFEGAAQRRGAFMQNMGQGLMTALSDKNMKYKVKKTNKKDMAKMLSSVDAKEVKKDSGINQFKIKQPKMPEPPKKKEDSGAKTAMIAKAAPKVLAALSDSESKKTMGDKSIKEDFLDKLQSYTYEYKPEHKNNPHAGKGTYTSVMAQDLEKAGPIGASMVETDDSGMKMVNYGKGFGAILAAQSHLNKRLEELEKKKRK